MWNFYSATSTSGYHSNTGILIFGLILFVIEVIAYWKIFVKAGEPGWKAIIPIYDIVITFKIAGKNPWMALLLLIPIVNIFVAGYLYVNLGRKFGKDGFWSVILMLILNPIGQLILAFGKSEYNGTPPVTQDPPLPPVAPSVPTANPQPPVSQ